MKKHHHPLLVSAVFGAALAASMPATVASPSVYPTGTTIYNPQKAYNSYVIFGSPDGKTHLIDLNGNEVHRWEKWGFPSELIDPAINGGKKGHFVAQLSSFGTGSFGNIFFDETIGELDWNGNVVWEWGKQAPDGKARQNHDWDRLPNGNTLVVSHVTRTVPALSDKPITDQAIYEITPKGKIVGQWYVADHITDLGISEEGVKLLRHYIAKNGNGTGSVGINDMAPIGPNKWYDAGDKRFAPENIVIDSPNASFVAIIEKKTGKVVWRLGPDFVADADDQAFSGKVGVDVPRPVDHLAEQHDAHIIPKGLPGAGNLLVFDNEAVSGYPPKKPSKGSRVLEINPITNEIVWQYTALNSDAPTWAFLSTFISSARRLPNGNTLIDEGQDGRLFQVTPAGEIVWEYISPYSTHEPLGDAGPASFNNGQGVKTNWVYRAQPVPYNWVPDGTPHSEKPVRAIDIDTFRVPSEQ